MKQNRQTENEKKEMRKALAQQNPRPTAEKRRKKTGHSCDRTKSEINVPKQVITGWKFPAPVRINAIWNPRRDSTDRKCEGGHRRGINQVRRRSQQSEVISWLRSPLQS